MDEYDRHYSALGLRRGAAQDEIRSAFRRLAKLYHPDHDASLDAEMRYREVRRAYDALRKKSETPKPPEHTEPQRPPAWTYEATRMTGEDFSYTASGDGWHSHDINEEEDDEDLLWGYDVDRRIPFSFGEAHIILWESVKETVSVEKVFRVLLYVFVMNNLLGWLGYGKLFSYTFIFCTLTGCAFFRYYLSGSSNTVTSRLKASFSWSLCYIACAALLLLMFSPNRSLFSIKNLFVVPFEMFISLLLLWAPPIFWKRRPKEGGFYI